jgi:hypothetical protein
MSLLLLALQSMPASAATDIGVLTVGRASGVPCAGGTFTASGYISPSMGSYSPTGLTGGQTVIDIHDVSGLCVNLAVVKISGFSSNPGSSWLTSVTCNGITKSSGSATYNYSAGTGSWGWTASLFALTPLAVGTNVSCTIVHN